MKSLPSFLALIAAAALLTSPASRSWSQAANFVSSVGDSSVAVPSVGEAALVQARLNQFNSALAAHNVTLLQAAGVKPVNAKRWQKFFKDNPAAHITDHCSVGALVISGDAATWDCTETATIVSEGKPLSFVHVIHFTFSKQDGIWMIADRK
jgi:hypothetical protein